jgi:hypothetical protein
MLALQAHLSCPHERRGIFEHKKLPDEAREMCTKYDSMAFLGGVDKWEPGADDDDDEFIG